MAESSLELMHREYEELFPTWDWQNPKPAQNMSQEIRSGLARANLDTPEPGNMEAMLALAFRCTNYLDIDLAEVLSARTSAWGSKIALDGEKIMELEETFVRREQAAFQSALNLKRIGNDRYKNLTEPEVIAEIRGSFLENEVGFLNHYCKEVDSAERRLARIALTYLPPENTWQEYIKN